MTDPFDQMQRAVDIVKSSAHPDNKIAATLFSVDAACLPYSISRTNYWPPLIETVFGQHARFGNASGTVHAETACLLAAPLTGGASLCVTDPFCPNCAKNIAEAGVRTVYIDHKGFEKDFAARRIGYFKEMSLAICARAGIAVYEMNRRGGTVTPIALPPYEAKDLPQPLEIMRCAFLNEATFMHLVETQRRKHQGRRIAVALASDARGRAFGLTERAHPSPGFAPREVAEDAPQKYSVTLEPLNRVLMTAARLGLKLAAGCLYSSQVPTAREQVNLAGAGYESLYVENLSQGRDDSALEAMRKLQTGGVLRFVDWAGPAGS